MNLAIVNMGHSARERLKAIAKASGRDANYVFSGTCCFRRIRRWCNMVAVARPMDA